jgi:hypothetical protein
LIEVQALYGLREPNSSSALRQAFDLIALEVDQLKRKRKREHSGLEMRFG